MKWKQQRQRWRGGVSLPVRGAWIEMLDAAENEEEAASRSPCGERGLKSRLLAHALFSIFVAPRAGSVD